LTKTKKQPKSDELSRIVNPIQATLREFLSNFGRYLSTFNEAERDELCSLNKQSVRLLSDNLLKPDIKILTRCYDIVYRIDCKIMCETIEQTIAEYNLTLGTLPYKSLQSFQIFVSSEVFKEYYLNCFCTTELFDLGYDVTMKFLYCNAKCFPFNVFENEYSHEVIEPNKTNKLQIPSEIKMIVEGCKMTLKELCVTDTYLDTIISKNISNN
jgi:hypothetical protein